MVLALARWLSVESDQRLELGRVIGSAGFMIAPVFLIFLEPDLGTALSYIVIWFGMLVAAGARPLYLSGFVASGLLSLPLAWLALRDYMRERMMTFIAVTVDPENEFSAMATTFSRPGSRLARVSCSAAGSGRAPRTSLITCGSSTAILSSRC